MHSHTILITGGAQGLGRHLASYLAGRGNQIIIFDIESFTNLPRHYRAVISAYHKVDLSDIKSLQRASDRVIVKHRCVDVLVNNAAMRVFKNFSAFSEQEIATYTNVNVIAPIMLIKKFFPMMKEHGYGRIINIASKSVYWGYRAGTLYCSTKSALVNFTEAFGRELDVNRDNVTINAICLDSFRSVDGKRFAGYDHVVSSAGQLIEDLLGSKRNAEIIPILRGRSKVHQVLRRLYEIYIWLRKY